MADKRDDGGPAFGGAYDDVLYDPSGQHPMMKMERRVSGMTLRDWFAGQALTGLLADQNVRAKSAEFAEGAYRIADAMLDERAK